MSADPNRCCKHSKTARFCDLCSGSGHTAAAPAEALGEVAPS